MNQHIVEKWHGTTGKQSYSYVVQDNITTSFTWAFRRLESHGTVSPTHIFILIHTCVHTYSYSPCWKKALIAFIPKEGKDMTDCKRYRPTQCLKQTVNTTPPSQNRGQPSLVDTDQIGFITNRQTQCNVTRAFILLSRLKTMLALLFSV